MGPNGELFRHYVQEWTEEQRSRIQEVFLEGAQ